jgi:N-acyl homoserine lactone hydrolase
MTIARTRSVDVRRSRKGLLGVSAAVLLMLSASALAAPKLYVFDCGLLRLADVSMFGLTAEETPVRELFVPCYLVEHEQGLLFWDGGLPLGVAQADGPVALDDGEMIYERSVIEQLADLGIAPADIRYAAFSHLHFDHVGAADAMAGAHVLIQRAEWETAFGDEPGFVDASLFGRLKDARMTLLDGDHDVFGDGRVQLISTPGHTPGHQVLLVDLENTGPILLSGDLYHFRESRALRRAPLFNFDANQTFDSMDKVEALLEARGATLWIEHDKALADTLRMAPEYYD